jgi:hypothetical protein
MSREFILKNGHRFRKAAIMLSEILCRFALVPFKAGFHIRFLEKIIALKGGVGFGKATPPTLLL